MRVLTNILNSGLAALLFWGCVAQKPATFSEASFASLPGCWQGTLNYSGTIIRKPYTTRAELVVTSITNNNYQLVHKYPTGEIRYDTLFISANEERINGAPVVAKQHMSNQNLELVTEAPGFDPDENKNVVVRQTYTINKENYTYKKQIRLEGQTEWLERQQFSYTRKDCSDK